MPIFSQIVESQNICITLRVVIITLNVLHYADIKCITLCEKVIPLYTNDYVMRKMYYVMR